MAEYRRAPQCKLRVLLRSVLDLALYHSDTGRITPVTALDMPIVADATPFSARCVDQLCRTIRSCTGAGGIDRVAVYFDGKVVRAPSASPAETATIGRLLRWHSAQAITPLAPPEGRLPAWLCRARDASNVASGAGASHLPGEGKH